MNFAFTEEQLLIQKTATTFFTDNATSKRTRAAMAARGFDAALWAAFTKDLGLAGTIIPSAHGGAGLGMVELAIIAEAAGYQVGALPMLGSCVLSAAALEAGGTARQKQAWLPKIAAGEAIAAWGRGDVIHAAGGKISGEIDFVAHGDIASVFVIHEPEAGATGWLISRDAPGVMVTPFTTLDETRPYARLKLQNVTAEPLADGRAGFLAAQQAGLVYLAAEALGGAQGCLDRTVAYAKDRVQFGRPVGSFQAYKHRLADMMIEIEQARSAVYWAACAVDEGSSDKMIALHGAKSCAADTFFMCAGNMIQLHGGIGFTWEHDAHLFLKRARAIGSFLGTSEWHREQVAREIGLGDVA